MDTALRQTGIGGVGDVPWGTHFCHFYLTRQDLVDVLVPYFRAGLESNECCVWVLSEPLGQHGVWETLSDAVPDFDRHRARGSIELLDARTWYSQDAVMDADRLTTAWDAKLEQALACGYSGLRVLSDTGWLEQHHWADFCAYEACLDSGIGERPLTVLCTYPLEYARATEMLDVVRTHQFAIARRDGAWERIETPQLRQAKEEVRRLNTDLEQRVAERTRQLEAANRELRELHDSLSASEAHLRQVAEAIPHQVWSVRPDGTVEYCNRRWVEETGLTLEDVQQDGWTRCLHPDDLETVAKAWRQARAVGRPYEVEQRQRGADGQYRRYVSRAEPLFDADGTLVQWFGTNTNVEERRQAEEAFHLAQRELMHVTRLTTMGELAASLAHEVNQPLAAIAANGGACARWLDRDVPDLAEARLALNRIIRDANRAREIIARTRCLTKKSPGERIPLDLADLIREMLLFVQPELGRHGVVVRERLAGSLPPVLGIRTELQQVVINLVVNGMEAMALMSDRPRELSVQCGAGQLDGSSAVIVTVSDAGVGIAADCHDRLFEPFHTTKAHGLGMGLAISQTIIQAHGGRLWAVPKPPPGATFQFALPTPDPLT